jgi:hypothetical protein
MNSCDDADLLIDVSRLRGSATTKTRHQLKKTAGNTSRPNSTNVGTVQGKRTHSASVGVAPSATQAQQVRRIEQRRAKPHKTATARVPSPLAASWAAVRFSKTGPKILVGTECSGLDSVMGAFDKMDLGDQAQLQFICEKDTAERNLILAHRRPNVVFNDITTRPIQKMPVCDIYSAGIPCQPWSSAGLGEGTDDRQGRGQIVTHV